jgi:hypothetical protein
MLFPFVFFFESRRDFGCPTLAAYLFLPLEWDR